MTVLLELGVLAACVVASALYSGSEIAYYAVSRTQLDVEATRGSALAGVARRLARAEGPLLVTILIGNNLALELATHAGEGLVHGALHDASAAAIALVTTAVLTPLVFLFGEALPKDLFRRRPLEFACRTAPFLFVSRVVFWPLERALRLATLAAERALGVPDERVEEARGKEALRTILAEGRRHGALHERAEDLAHNALGLRAIPVRRAMLPWAEVETIRADARPDEQLDALRSSRFTRLPVVGEEGEVVGFVHQLEALHAVRDDESAVPLLGRVRPLLELRADTPVDRALLALRGGGRRVAVVVEEARPVGFLTLKDLLEEISGDLADL